MADKFDWGTLGIRAAGAIIGAFAGAAVAFVACIVPPTKIGWDKYGALGGIGGFILGLAAGSTLSFYGGLVGGVAGAIYAPDGIDMVLKKIKSWLPDILFKSNPDSDITPSNEKASTASTTYATLSTQLGAGTKKPRQESAVQMNLNETSKPTGFMHGGKPQNMLEKIKDFVFHRKPKV